MKAPSLSLSAEEKAFIKNHPEIRVSNEMDWPPFDYVRSGLPAGFSVDFVRLLASKVGLKIRFINGFTFTELLEQFQQRRIDLVHSVYKNPKRETYGRYSQLYYSSKSHFIIDRASPEITELADLFGKKLAVVKGWTYELLLKEKYPQIEIYPVSSVLEGLKAVDNGLADAAAEYKLVAQYHIRKYSLTDLKISGWFKEFDTVYPKGLHLLVRKDWPVLSKLFDKLIRSVTLDEIRILENKWLRFDKETQEIILSEKEKTFIRKHPEIILGTDSSWEPYVIVDKEGQISGYDHDILTRINRRTGANFKLETGKWKDILSRAASGNIDGLSTSARHPERRGLFRFSDVYLSLRKMIFVSKFNPLDITGPNDLLGKRILVQRGNLLDEKYSRRFKDARIIYRDSVEEIIRGLVNGEGDAAIGSAAHIYIASRENLPFIKVAFSLDRTMDLVFSVRKDWPEAVSILNRGLSSIDDVERRRLMEKWFRISGSTLGKQLQPLFSEEERKYLADKSEIRMAVDPNWMPFEGIDKKGNYIGVVAEYISYFEARLGIPFKLVSTGSFDEALTTARNEGCDILTAVAPTENRREFLNFTEPYLSFPYVIVTRQEVGYIEKMDQVLDKKFAVVRGYAIIDELKARYPALKIVLVDHNEAGLEKVMLKEVFGYIDAVPTVSHMIQTQNLSELKISSQLDLTMDLAIGIIKRDLILPGIMQKLVETIDEKERRRIYNKWINVRYEQGFDYALFWKIFGIVSIVLIVILYWNRQLAVQIARRKAAEASLQATQAELEQNIRELEKAKGDADRASRAKSEFLANMSHELRTPLNAVIGFSELLTSILTDSDQKNYVRSIKSAGRSLLTLINDILDLSKIEAGQVVIKPVEVDLRALLTEMDHIFRSQIEKKGIRFQIEVDKQIPDIVRVDELRLRQVLLNLIGNASKFTHSGHIDIHLHDGNGKDGQDRGQIDLFFEIEDSGIGIAEDKQAQVFESFKQDDSIDIHAYGGTGLGLPISKKLIEKMGGTISLQSHPGKGSLFLVHLAKVPVIDLGLNLKRKDRGLTIEPGLESLRFERGRILVVDDIESNRLMISGMLERIGFDVELADNGEIAIDKVSRDSFDLIFMDLRMPRMDGIQAIRILKENLKSKDIPVVALTASTLVERKEKLKRLGFADILYKPFQVKELVSILSIHFRTLSEGNSDQDIAEAAHKSTEFDGTREIGQLHRQLRHKILPEIKSLRTVMIMKDIGQFALELARLGESHRAKYLVRIAVGIEKAASEFDSDAIESHFSDLIRLVERLEANQSSD